MRSLFKNTAFPVNQKNFNAQWVIVFGSLLFLLTIFGATHNFRYTMMGLITFLLAYISKGIRRRSSS